VVSIAIRDDFEALDNAIIESINAGHKKVSDISKDVFNIASEYIFIKYYDRPICVNPVVTERVLHMMHKGFLYCVRGEGWEVVRN